MTELEALGRLDSLDEAVLRDGSTALSPPARCAALTALLDLRGRVAANKSSQDESSGPVECNATLVAGEPAAVAAQKAVKHALDPKGLFNPGKKEP